VFFPGDPATIRWPCLRRRGAPPSGSWPDLHTLSALIARADHLQWSAVVSEIPQTDLGHSASVLQGSWLRFSEEQLGPIDTGCSSTCETRQNGAVRPGEVDAQEVLCRN